MDRLGLAPRRRKGVPRFVAAGLIATVTLGCLFRPMGGHNLPGSATLDLPRLLGRKCQDVQAAVEIWSFFATHTLSPAHGGSTGPVLGR